LLWRQNSRKVQVRFCCPAPSFGAPVTQHRRAVQAGHAAGAGQLIYIGSNPVQDRRHPGKVGHHVRPLGAIAIWAQVDRRREPLGVQVGQPPGALAQPAGLIEQAVADQVAAVQPGVVIPVGVFRGRPVSRPQFSQGGLGQQPRDTARSRGCLRALCTPASALPRLL
jgi:hypothetical protein